MRLSQYFIQTLREAPADAEISSHVLMMRAGMIRKLAAGIYSYLPMGLRTIRKIENIIRECMNEAGAIELLMPSVQPAELWQESGRWEQYGKELLRIKDRHNRDFCYGPTHEEVVTEIVRGNIKSYKQLPVNLYQIQTKFRDEVRPRFGLMRGREFIMKDAYSFDINDSGANISYEKMRKAYCRIFEKCGLKYKMVEADSGAIGGSFSHEFMVLAQTGEDAVISCKGCEYAANMEKAQALKPVAVPFVCGGKVEEIATPGVRTVEEVAAFLNVPVTSVIKTIIVKINNKDFAAVTVRGDHEANLIKLKNLLNVSSVEMAEASEILAITGSPAGFCGPLGLTIPVYADFAVEDVDYGVVGANKKDFHIKNIKCGKDFLPVKLADLRNAMEGDICPVCGGEYEIARGIEVGHIFKLGTKYSEAMDAKYLDQNGKQQAIVMGCYGIGVGRVSAASVEQNNDSMGICWPIPIAPFEIAVLSLNPNDADVVSIAENVYDNLIKHGVDAVVDDRADRAGSKLADADLIGYPLRINVGKKNAVEGNVELVVRRTGESFVLDPSEAVAKAVEIILSAK